jgi:ABC-type multidrug transport system fused ATPase/permease subunit
VIGEVITMLGIVIIMFGLEWRLALLTLSVVPFLFIFILSWQTRARRTFIKVRQAASEVNSALEENISGVRVIQSLTREDLNIQQFEKVNRANLEANLQSARVSAASMPAVELLLSLATAGLIIWGGLGVMNNTLLVGTLLTFIIYINNFFDPIRNLTMEYAQLQIAMASGSRIFELLDLKPEITDAPAALKPEQFKGHIQFERVGFHYIEGIDVLKEINLEIIAGQTVALVGPTGVGKSTILNLIARFYDITSGRILIDGIDVRQLDSIYYRRHIGLVLQDPFLFSGTIKDNIAYGKLGATFEEIRNATRAVGAEEFILKLEKGFDTVLEERGQNLSLGQRQLISFARALIADPVILLLDEATASVDSYSEQVIQKALQRLKLGRTTVIIAHRLSTIRDADRIFVLDEGRVAEEGSHTELLKAGKLYSKMYLRGV